MYSILLLALKLYMHTYMSTLLLFISTPTHTSCTEAVVLFDYEKQHHDELNLEVGDVITDIKQVCEPLLPQDYHTCIGAAC